jgi:glycosyltransferase involved in cell wall biosynthesis
MTSRPPSFNNASLPAGAKTLYLCYFGVREPLVQTQVIPYLREIVAGGVAVTLLTFEPRLKDWRPHEREEWRDRLASWGIRWISRPYHKRPTLPATVYDIISGAVLVAKLVRRDRIDVLHARGHIPATMAYIGRAFTGARLLFDIRGFMPEEYTDGGIWRKGGFLFRAAKAVERVLMNAADGFVVLTNKAREILFPGAVDDRDLRGRPIEVIPCCVDFERFSADEHNGAPSSRLAGLETRDVFVYVGSLGTWYLLDAMADLFAAARARNPRAFALILTQSAPELMTARFAARGLSPEDYRVERVDPVDVPRYLRGANAAVSLIKACYSKQSSSPTKIAEYLAMGLPVICNRGVGDLDELIEQNRVGVLISELDAASYAAALDALDALRRDPSLRERCRATALAYFDLSRVGGPRYRELYRRLLAGAADA